MTRGDSDGPPGGEKVRRFCSQGDEFSENGVELEPGRPMFRIPLDEEVVFRGKVLKEASRV